MKSGNSKIRGGKSKVSGGRSRIGGKSRLGAGRSRFGGGRSRKGRVKGMKGGVTTKTSDKGFVAIFDRNGNFANPKPLLIPVIPNTGIESIEQQTQEKKTGTLLGEQTSILQSSINQSLLQTGTTGKSPSNSVDKSSDSALKRSDSQYGLDESSMGQSRTSDYTEDSDTSKNKSQSSKRKKRKKKQKQSGEDDIIINLLETETETLLFIPSKVVQQEPADYYQSYKDRNKAYDDFKEKNVGGNENLQPRSAQTFNLAPKKKKCRTEEIITVPKETLCTTWDLYDTAQKKVPDFFEQIQKNLKKMINKQLEEKIKVNCMLPTDFKSLYEHEKSNPFQQIFEEKEVTGTTKTRRGGRGTTYGGNQTSAYNRDNMQDSTSYQDSQSGTFTQSRINQSTRFNARTNRNVQASKTQQKKDRAQQLINIQQVQNIQKVEDKDALTEKQQKIYNDPIFTKSLTVMERILNQNDYQSKYIQYRNYPEVQNKQYEKFFNQMQKKGQGRSKMGQTFKRIPKKGQKEQEVQEEKKVDINKKRFEKLFTYSCEATKGWNISQIDINPYNSDLIVASYGGFEVEKPSTGKLCLWTLKSPKYPERIIETNCRITSCKFSDTNPNLVAAGDYNGVISIFDIRSKGNKPIIDSCECENKHIDAVWEIQWIKSGTQDQLVSISSDGRIVEWQMKKKFENNDLMKLKRQHSYSTKDSQGGDPNFRSTIGFSFDFIPGEAGQYLAATEDGNIQLCSRTYTDNTIWTFNGHEGPVYKVRCNQFCGNIFLTCSADWSCKLWNQRQTEKPLLHNFQSLNFYSEVMDVEWCPYISTVFANVAKDGRIELWDLEHNTMDSCISIKPNDDEVWPSKNVVRFSKENPILVTGDAVGDLDIYRLYGYDDYSRDVDAQREKLIKIVAPAGYMANDKDAQEN